MIAKLHLDDGSMVRVDVPGEEDDPLPVSNEFMAQTRSFFDCGCFSGFRDGVGDFLMVPASRVVTIEFEGTAR